MPRSGALTDQTGFGLTLRFFFAKALAAHGLVGKRLPRGFRSLASLPHVRQRRRLPLGPRLLGTGEEEGQV